MQSGILKRQVTVELKNRPYTMLAGVEPPEPVMCCHCRRELVSRKPTKGFITIGQFAHTMLVIFIGIGICSALLVISIKVRFQF